MEPEISCQLHDHGYVSKVKKKWNRFVTFEFEEIFSFASDFIMSASGFPLRNEITEGEIVDYFFFD